MRRIIHMAAKVNANGDMSALCSPTPRPINMRRASWSLQSRFVTCRKCARILRERAQEQQKGMP